MMDLDIHIVLSVFRVMTARLICNVLEFVNKQRYRFLSEAEAVYKCVVSSQRDSCRENLM